MNKDLRKTLDEYFTKDSGLYKDVEGLMELAIKDERARCRQIANHYEKGPDVQAAVAGKIRQQIESPVQEEVHGRCKGCNEPVPPGFYTCNGDGSHPSILG